MSETTIRVPAAVPGNPSDVATALEVASALWGKGSREDAIRWIKRAVEAATEAGQSERADALMTSVVELEQAPEGPAEGPPAEGPPAEAAAPAPASTAPKPPPAPGSKPSTTPRAATNPPPLPAAASRAPAPPAKPATSVSPRATSQPAPGTAVARGRVTAPQQTAVARPAPVRLPAGQRIRVSVRTSVRDPGMLVVRPLAEGRPLPPGTREGSLVLEDDEDDDARSHANGSAPS